MRTRNAPGIRNKIAERPEQSEAITTYEARKLGECGALCRYDRRVSTDRTGDRHVTAGHMSAQRKSTTFVR